MLVTGANGFLGRHVVAALRKRGHGVRALIRPAAVADPAWTDDVEVFRCDLRQGRNLAAAFEGVDVLVHLAAATSGDEEGQFANSVVATERLLDAMRQSSTRRLVLASTFSVYDFAATGRKLTEDSPLEADVYARDAYPVAKIWQERLTRRVAAAQGWELTVLRPGFIWGRKHEYLACLGQRVGPVHLVISPLAHLPLTYVENCADCFAAAAENPKAAGQTLNVIDDDRVRTWGYLGQYLRRGGHRGWRVPVPYRLALGVALLAKATSRMMFGAKGKLPGILVPIRFRARFRPLRYPTRRLREVLGWTPPLSYAECLRRTYAREELRVTLTKPTENVCA